MEAWVCAHNLILSLELIDAELVTAATARRAMADLGGQTTCGRRGAGVLPSRNPLLRASVSQSVRPQRSQSPLSSSRGDQQSGTAERHRRTLFFAMDGVSLTRGICMPDYAVG